MSSRGADPAPWERAPPIGTGSSTVWPCAAGPMSQLSRRPRPRRSRGSSESRTTGCKSSVTPLRRGAPVPSGDGPALGDRLSMVVGDASIQNRLGEAGALRAAEYSPERVAQRLHEALVRTVAG